MASPEFLEYVGLKTMPKGFWKKDNKLQKDNILKWVKWFEKTNNIQTTEGWYRITAEQINQAGARGFFTSKAENALKESMYKLMKFVYPDYKWIPYNFIQAPHGYWKIRENRVQWCEAFRADYNIQSLDDFYKFKVEDFEKYPGCCMGFYGNSLIKMLKDLYREKDWLEWRFEGQVSKNFWTNSRGELIYENIMRWFQKEIIETYAFKTNKDMYKLTQKLIAKHYGGGLSSHVINGSPMQLLQFLYPDYDWLFWKFVSAPNNAWDHIENHRKYLLYCLNGSPLEMLYKFSVKGFPASLTIKYESLYDMAMKCFPQYNWQESLFSCHKTIAILREYVKLRFPGLTIIPEFRLDNCKNPKTTRSFPFDLCIVELKTILELDGMQHFRQVSNWAIPEDTIQRDIFKMQKANESGYKVIRIFQEDVYNNYKSSYTWLDENLLPEIKSSDRTNMVISTIDTLYDQHIELLESGQQILLSDSEDEESDT